MLLLQTKYTGRLMALKHQMYLQLLCSLTLLQNISALSKPAIKLEMMLTFSFAFVRHLSKDGKYHRLFQEKNLNRSLTWSGNKSSRGFDLSHNIRSLFIALSIIFSTVNSIKTSATSILTAVKCRLRTLILALQ